MNEGIEGSLGKSFGAPLLPHRHKHAVIYPRFRPLLLLAIVLVLLNSLIKR
jgi:hypothetical protein